MKLITTIAELRAKLDQKRKSGSIGFIPTMGYLHEGHISLVEASKKENSTTVMSIFVNPTQFGPNEDLTKYPRDIDRDSAIARSAGVDIIFYPSVQEMYPEKASTFVEVEGMGEILCGRYRPGHFKGVATVVAMLFNIVRPDRAYFGQKDAQQVAVLKKMLRDLHFELEIIACPTLREVSGLAKSSRNIFLKEQEKDAATVLSRALFAGMQKAKSEERNADKILTEMKQLIEQEPLVELQYLEIVDGKNLTPMTEVHGDVLIAVAAFVGKTRLIDNVQFTL